MMAGQTTGIDWRGGTFDAAAWRAREHFREAALSGKTAAVTDNHQYAILSWQRFAAACETPPVLVSIDYHPDTNPPFWFDCFARAAARDPARAEALSARYQRRCLEQIRSGEKTLLQMMPRMNNDEQILTARSLAILSDFHMINCMAAHKMPEGRHYLTAYDGDLSDAMFARCGAADALSSLLASRVPVILDIDLDYFPGDTFGTAGALFAALVRRAGAITIARSATYYTNLSNNPADTLAMLEESAIFCLKMIDETG